ncbi:S41 family peptidase [Algisphaera agarilytica]|uniref:C-terminal peptidase prc n=1 Tax=Algisphaera agarilytica TaxID=1385975 RepID=A0A7X0H8A9_9BACT|nr:S41 family peptidase [Algisphaera agarilytica]MBB6430963.1 C-terminal peptidase prc [Algisphaera agarilytica]
MTAVGCVLAFSAGFASPSSADEALASLETMASEGRFDDLLNAIQADPNRHEAEDAASLVASLERYRENEQVREQRRTDAYEDAFETVSKEIEAGDLEEALVAAIEAHSIADAPLLVLRDPAVMDLVKKTEIAAKQAELDEDWVEASVLFGRLHLLYEEDARYRDDVKRVSSHLRVLALYAPEELRALQEARAKRVGREDELNRARPDDETWETRLSGINDEMLRESLRTVAQFHIDHEGYNKLLVGAIEPLLTLLDTPSLAGTFESLGDEAKRNAFRGDLLRMKAELIDADRELTEFRALSRLDEILAQNQRTVKLPEAVMVYEMTEGALGTLDDFSSMYWPEDIDFLSRSTQGSFTGIGVQIAKRNEQLTVVSPLNGTPAQRAGLKADDVIATVNGKDTSSWSLNKAVREITGPRGTEVELGIRRIGEPELLPYTIKRDRIEIQSVKGWAHTEDGGWDYWIDQPSGIGYIRLTQFIPQSVNKIDQAVADLQRTGHLNSLILDLRHNPGGLLTSAIDIVNRFLDDGPILYTVDGDQEVQSYWDAKRRDTYPDFEVVILINRGSASASEIVSGALQDRDRAFVIGDRSYGKGSVQDVHWFPPRTREPKYGLKVTTQYYQLPKGRIIHRKPDSETWGIDPDLTVDVTNQTVAWNLELRQEIDVIRDADADSIEVKMTKPWVELGGFTPVDIDADNADETVEVPRPQPHDLLDLGLDPQLEAALLVLKTRQIVEDTAVAQATE